jgi:hypothetical protein
MILQEQFHGVCNVLVLQTENYGIIYSVFAVCRITRELASYLKG